MITAAIIWVARRCNTTAPRCGVCPVALARRSKNGIWTDAWRGREGGTHHQTRSGSGRSANTQGQANSNMVSPDPAAGEFDQLGALAVVWPGWRVGRACQPSPWLPRKLSTARTLIEKGQPCGAIERRDLLARKGRQRRPPDQQG